MAPRLTFFPKSPPQGGAARQAAAPEGKSAFPAFVPIDALGHTAEVRTTGAGWFRAHWLLYACVSYRAEKLMEPPLWIKEERDGTEEWIEGDHPLAELLEQPNPDMDMSEFLQEHSYYMDTGGRCLWVKSRDRMGRVAQLHAYRKGEFEVRRAGGRVYGSFSVNTAKGRTDLAPTEVLYFRNPDPDNRHDSVAPLDAALARLGIDGTLAESIRAGLKNAIVPGFVVEMSAPTAGAPAPTADQLREINANLSALYEGARRHGKGLALPAGARGVRNKLGFAGLEGGALAEENEVAICAAFRLPPVVVGAKVGLRNSSDRHNLESSIEIAYDNVFVPAWTRIGKAMTRGLLREADPNPLRFIRFDTSGVKALQPNIGAAADVAAKTGDFEMVNDRLRRIGAPPLPDSDPRGRLIVGIDIAGVPANASGDREP